MKYLTLRLCVASGSFLVILHLVFTAVYTNISGISVDGMANSADNNKLGTAGMLVVSTPWTTAFVLV